MKRLLTYSLGMFLLITSMQVEALQKKLPKEFDPVLKTTELIVKNHYATYLSIMSQASQINKDKLADMHARKSFTPEDVVLATGLARAINSRTDLVLRHYSSHRSVGWMIMATMKKAKKGSKKYKQWLSELEQLNQSMKMAIAAKTKKEKPKKKSSKSSSDKPKDSVDENKASKKTH